ncbi:MAG: TAXI family TRAP transporter solute-binding subunit [Alphaproteobacteria bacterium]|nr:TAXI family TRAP transporter solute-binding subunit [Alphaproteobacteria bacterium]MBU1551605.1 TAXI family TRAP transporter solute-binding subunit [Alphaproteobacteria bacterium]MBU2337340.1 TAXI family TRAP transporter solute-binding subunit [Alphaproteobacteria bacterium]MBU2388083.1 TAXI family TRAP transporter solute-binding subunit [Alphaproteobacteria bacterium]
MKHQLFAAALAAGLAAFGSASAQTVGIATSNPGSIFHNIGTAVAKAANDAGLNATIQPATSPNQYMPLVNQNDVEFGVGNLEEFNNALSGEAWFAGSVNDRLRVVGLIMPIKEAIFVRADSDIKTTADLKGKPMVDGYTAQQTILPQLDAIYATAGLSRADMQPVQVPSVVAGADAFISGESVGFIFAHGAGKVREADAAVGGLRALTIPDTEEAKAAIRQHWKSGYVVTMEPGPANPGVLETGSYIAYPQLVFTNTEADEEAVYRMTKVLYESKDAMQAAFPPFAAFEPKDMVGDTTPGEYHPGAIRFYKEVGLWKE